GLVESPVRAALDPSLHPVNRIDVQGVRPRAGGTYPVFRTLVIESDGLRGVLKQVDDRRGSENEMAGRNTGRGGERLSRIENNMKFASWPELASSIDPIQIDGEELLGQRIVLLEKTIVGLARARRRQQRVVVAETHGRNDARREPNRL